MDRWFDGDYSECYIGWNEHADKMEFAMWVFKQDPDYGCPAAEEIEHLWATETAERFYIVPESTEGAVPITRFRP